MSQRGESKMVYAPALTGGLDRKTPPNRLDPSVSPNSENVLHHDMTAKKRGGFVPFAKSHARLAALKNRGYHARSKLYSTATEDSDYLIVPGMMVAGHRTDYDNLDTFTIEFFCTVDDLTKEHGGDSQQTGVFGGAPYRLSIRPIVSKGPVKKTLWDSSIWTTAETAAPGGMDWEFPPSASASFYDVTGSSTNAGLPFAVYLWQSTVDDEWYFNFSVQGVAGTDWTLPTVQSSIIVETGPIYHVIASCEFGTIQGIKVGIWDEEFGAFQYEPDNPAGAGKFVTQTLVGVSMAGSSPTPIQLFDCPQAFIENPTGAQPLANDVPTGWGYDASAGGYFFRSKRFEGTIDDLVIWREAIADEDETGFDRRLEKLDLDNLDHDIVNYWDMSSGDFDVVKEGLGKGNHFFPSPAGPVTTQLVGGRSSERSTSWYFNGVTSYAMPHLWRHPSWRLTETQERAFLRQVLDNELGLGLAATFRPDSVAEPFNQVVAEIHGVMQLSINPSGKIQGMCRGDSSGALRPVYSSVVESSFVVEAGIRYDVALFWGIPTNGNRPLTLFVNGQAEDTINVPRDVDHADDKYPPGGMTFGMGARNWTSHTQNSVGDADDLTADEVTVMVDSRSGFIGVIEEVKILSGSFPPSADGLLDQEQYRDQNKDDWTIQQPKLWVAPSDANRNVVSTWALDLTARLGTGSTTGGGHALRASTWNQNREEPQIYAQQGDGTGHVIYPDLLRVGDGGVEGPSYSGFSYGLAALLAGQLSHISIETFWVFARWQLGAYTEQVQRSGCWHYGQEGRPPSTTPAKRRDWLHGIWEQNALDQTEDTGNLGRFVFKRCKEPDLITEIMETSWATLGYTAPSPTQVGYGGAFHAQRPYGFMDPDELAPIWTEGLAMPPLGKTEVTLAHDFTEMRSRENLRIAASSRNIYWMHPVWRAESPFDEDSPASLWSAGAPGDYVRFGASTLNAAYASLDDDSFSGDWSLLHFECWLKPHKLDGFRLVAAKGDYRAQTWNYVIGFLEGALTVTGTLATGSWQYREEQGAGLGSRLRPNAWNHLWVRMGRDGVGSASVYAWINGEPAKLILSSGYVALDSDTPDSQTAGLYMCGLPRGRERIDNGVEVILAKPWCGLITEFRQLWDDESPVVPTGPHPPSSLVGIVVPTRRYEDDEDPDEAVYHVHLDQTYGWYCPNIAPYRPASTIGNPDNGIVQLKQWIRIDGPKMRDSTGWPWRAIALRDRLYLTNGVQDPLELAFTKWSDPKGPFRLWRMGMEAGKRAQHSPTTYLYDPHDAVLGSPAASDYLQQGIYQIWVSFIDEDYRESEPVVVTAAFNIKPVTVDVLSVSDLGGGQTNVNLGGGTLPDEIANGNTFHVELRGIDPSTYNGIYTATKTSPTTMTITFAYAGAIVSTTDDFADIYADGVRITGIPRSNQAQCIGRRIYFSATGGGLPIWHSDILDNVSQMAEIWGGGAGFQMPEPGRRLTPGRARLISAGQGSVVLANFPSQESGGNIVMISDAEEPIYFSLSLRVRVDSSQGDSILGLQVQTAFYVLKRSSTWFLNLRTGTFESADHADSAGAGAVVHDRRITGADERGVHVFSGSDVLYVGSPIEPDWREISRREKDLLEMFGASHRDFSQYWLSLREPGDTRNGTIYVLHTGIGQVWSKLRVPLHSYMANGVNPTTQRPQLMLGTIDGQLLVYNDAILADGHDAGTSWINNNPNLVDGTVDGTQTGVVYTLSSVSQGFYDIAGDGLRGLPIYLSFTDDSGVGWEDERIIESNDLFSATWTEPLSGDWGTNPTRPIRIQIGGYDAHWSSGWVGDTMPGEFSIFKNIYVEHEPSTCTLTVEYETALGDRASKGLLGHPQDRDLPSDPVAQTISLRSGVQIEPVPMNARANGRYARVVFRTGRTFETGLENGWSITSWALTHAPATIVGRGR